MYPSILLPASSKATALVTSMHAHGGLAPVDLDSFWRDQDEAVREPFGKQIRQVPLGIRMSWECVFDELGVEVDHWKYLNDHKWRMGFAKAYNDKAERIVGRRLIDESPAPLPEDGYPPVKSLHDIFEARNEWRENSWWLMKSAGTPDELEALLDRVEKKNIRSIILPENWDEHKEQLLRRGIKPAPYRTQRGPVTFAASIYGAENLIFLILEHPDLAARFRDVILRVMLDIARILDTEAGYGPEDRPRGFSFFDDNCCLLTPEMYGFFGYPVLKRIFGEFSPLPGDWRYQHSDSAMGHLLGLLGTLNFSQVNFGPTITVSEIRSKMPGTVIEGQLAPFTFSRNEEEKIVEEFLRDFEQAKESRGLLFATAGSINNGSRLTGMRLIMAAIQRYGRYG